MKYEKRAGGIAISIKTCSLVSQQFQRKLEMSTQSAVTVAEECFAIFQEKFRWEVPVRAIESTCRRFGNESIYHAHECILGCGKWHIKNLSTHDYFGGRGRHYCPLLFRWEDGTVFEMTGCVTESVLRPLKLVVLGEVHCDD